MDIAAIVTLPGRTVHYGPEVFHTKIMERALVGWRTYNQEWRAPLFHEHGVSVLSSVVHGCIQRLIRHGASAPGSKTQG